MERALMMVNQNLVSVARQVALLDKRLENLDAFVSAARSSVGHLQDVRARQPAPSAGEPHSLDVQQFHERVQALETSALHPGTRSLWSSRITSKKASTRKLRALLQELEAKYPHLNADLKEDTLTMQAIFREALLTCARNSERSITIVDDKTIAIRDGAGHGGKVSMTIEAAMKRVFYKTAVPRR